MRRIDDPGGVETRVWIVASQRIAQFFALPALKPQPKGSPDRRADPASLLRWLGPARPPKQPCECYLGRQPEAHAAGPARPANARLSPACRGPDPGQAVAPRPRLPSRRRLRSAQGGLTSSWGKRGVEWRLCCGRGGAEGGGGGAGARTRPADARRTRDEDSRETRNARQALSFSGRGMEAMLLGGGAEGGGGKQRETRTGKRTEPGTVWAGPGPASGASTAGPPVPPGARKPHPTASFGTSNAIYCPSEPALHHTLRGDV